MRTITTFFFSILVLGAMLLPKSVHAQVTIGSSTEPNLGALLDLKESNNAVNTTKGLGMPRVALVIYNQLDPCFATNGKLDAALSGIGATTIGNQKIAHTGLLVWNTTVNATNKLSKGLHVWSGTEWVPLYPELLASPAPSLNTITPATANICANVAVAVGTYTATTPTVGAAVRYYDAATGGNLITFPHTPTANTTYYAEAYMTADPSIKSVRVLLATLTHIAIPSVTPTHLAAFVRPSADIPLCPFTTSPSTGTVVTWHTAATAGSVVSFPTSTAVDGTKYYAQVSDRGCVSPTRVAVTVNLKPTLTAIQDGDSNPYEAKWFTKDIYTEAAGDYWLTSNLHTTKLADQTTPIANLRLMAGGGNKKEIVEIIDEVEYWASTDPYYISTKGDLTAVGTYILEEGPTSTSTTTYTSLLSVAQKYGLRYTAADHVALKLCPTGWHISTKANWDDLVVSLGGNAAATKALKADNNFYGYTLTNLPDSEDAQKPMTQWGGVSGNTVGFNAYPAGGNWSGDTTIKAETFSEETLFMLPDPAIKVYLSNNIDTGSSNVGPAQSPGSIRCVKDK